jgi:hypothetical protein
MKSSRSGFFECASCMKDNQGSGLVTVKSASDRAEDIILKRATHKNRPIFFFALKTNKSFKSFRRNLRDGTFHGNFPFRGSFFRKQSFQPDWKFRQ